MTPNAKVPANRTPTEVSNRSPLRRATQPMPSAVPTAASAAPEEERPAEHECDDQTRKRGVADRVADEGEPLEDHEGAHDRADDADHERCEQATLHEAVGERVGQEADEVHEPAPSWKWRS